MMPPDSLPVQSQTKRGLTLEQEVRAFSERLIRRHPERFASEPERTKKLVLKMILRDLPPRPNRGGRKPVGYISEALKLYRQQRLDIKVGKRKAINWSLITDAVIPHFKDLRTELRRRWEIGKLRQAVYARLRREENKRRRRRPGQTP